MKSIIHNVNIPQHKAKALIKIISLFFLTATLFLLGNFYYLKYNNKKLEQQIISTNDLVKCFSVDDKKNTVPNFKCLESTTEKLLQATTTKDLMKYIVFSSPEIIKNNCHVISHIVGEITYSKLKSLEEATAACTTDCVNGCLHGVVEEAVETELHLSGDELAHANPTTIENIGRQYCEKSAPFCHAVGHIIFESFQDYPSSLKMCSTVSGKNEMKTETCRMGVFMESVGSSLSISRTKYENNHKNSYGFPCNTINNSEYMHACFYSMYDFQKKTFYEKGINEPEEKLKIALNTCSQFKTENQLDCFEYLGYYSKYFLPQDSLNRESICKQISDENDHQNACSFGLITNLIWSRHYKEVLEHCQATEENKQKELCYNHVFQTTNVATSSICENSNYTNECIDYFAKYSKFSKTLPIYYLGFNKTK